MLGRGCKIMIVLFIGLFLAGSASVSTVWAAGAPRISMDALKSQIDDPDVVIIDVRQESDWKSSSKKIRNAEREDPADLESWAGDYSKDKTIVLYCA